MLLDCAFVRETLSDGVSTVSHKSRLARVLPCICCWRGSPRRGSSSLEGDEGTTKQQALFILSSTCSVIITSLFHYAACNHRNTHL